MKIKALLLSIFMTTGLFFQSCTSDELLFDIDTIIDFTILAGSSPERTLFFETEILFPYTFQLGNIGFSEADVDFVRANTALMISRDGLAPDLDFIDEIIIDVINPVDDLDTKEIFFIERIPFGNKSEIRLNPSLSNIEDFIFNDRLKIRLALRFRSIPTRNINGRIEARFGALMVG